MAAEGFFNGLPGSTRSTRLPIPPHDMSQEKPISLLGRLAVQLEFITPDQLRQANLAQAELPNRQLGDVLVDMGFIDGLRLLNWNDCEPHAPGAIVACDDYGFDSLRDAVRAAADGFLRDRSEQALHLPSGQCLLIRPPKT